MIHPVLDTDLTAAHHDANRQLLAQLLPPGLGRTGHPALTEEEQIGLIAEKFRDIMQLLGLDTADDSLKDTPVRVAKMYVQELFTGLRSEAEPKITLFRNDFRYGELLIERNIPVYSSCEHHFVPIIGKAHIGYIAGEQVIGLSKLNRIVHYYARRPQVQERLTVQIAEHLMGVLGTEDVAVVIDAEHLCVAARGVRDTGASTITTSFHGRLSAAGMRREFLSLLHLK